MNSTIHSTGAGGKPAVMRQRTDKEIVDAFDNLLGDVYQLRRAALVLDEYANNEFRDSRDLRPDTIFDYGMSKDQVDGITYMTDHVRSLSWALERAFDKAFGLEAQS
ncbi:hypothetical protein [Rhizobium rhizogenes]|uniref:hypothetical protein n=1 Tax=Rhizobium rhizogenes TaxID=359 RepID=UPI0015723908|nr:hypothetical protein [Rhizobium rhizogenes]NTI41587.1 hypothetical protein [Rhizobium rhizogenes]